jgi:lipoprotein-anchoring transpeptidase ErfK/SrfK
MGDRTSRQAIALAFAIAPLIVAMAACGGGDQDPLAAPPYDAGDSVTYAVPAGGGGGKADPARPLEITAKGDDRITDVTAVDGSGHYLNGELSDDGMRWRSTSTPSAGARYTVRVSTEDGEGHPGRKTLTVDTSANDHRLRVRFGPDPGTYGVGQPITAELSAPVKGRAARAVVERNLHVSAGSTAAEGAWYWVDSRTLHYRPRVYWPARDRIEVRATLDGVRVAKGLYGGAAEPLRLLTGDEVVAITDAATHQLTLLRDGEAVRTVPVTTGKPGFDTRNGTKVVLGQEAVVRMQSSTVGIAAGSSESYDLDVYWATRVTWSGEYVHAAPWSVDAQGVANISHGCTGMSTENARWFFDNVRRGDIVRVVGSLGPEMAPFGNGFGDWNLSWEQWLSGSVAGARHEVATAHTSAAVAGRLRPQL